MFTIKKSLLCGIAATAALGFISVAGGTAARADTPAVGGNITQAIIDLRQARGYLNLPNKFDMTDPDWSAVRHVSDAIKNAQDAGVSDGGSSYFTPAISVTLSHSERLWKAKELVRAAKDELAGYYTVHADAGSTLASFASETDAASHSIDKAIAAEDWKNSWSNNWQDRSNGSSW